MKSMKGTIILVIITAVILIVSFLLINSAKLGFSLSGNNAVKEKQYDTIYDFEKEQNRVINIPTKIKGYPDIQTRVSAGSFVEIMQEHYVLKVGPFADYNADPLALYDNVENDFKYFVNNNDSISFLRYRYKYPELSNCTIVNWVSGGYSYGLIFDRVIDKDELLNIFEVNYSDLKEIKTTDENNSNSDEFIKIDVEDKYVLSIPTTESDITHIDIEDKTMLYLNGSLIIVICNAEDDEFNTGNIIELENGYELRYPEKNPFGVDTVEYKDYIRIIEKVDDIVNSIEYK